MLWIALHLPKLSLESFAATLAPAGRGASAQPVALLEAHRVVSADAAALALGVKPGLKKATALALAPQIVLGQADARRDTDAMLPIAHAALAFTPNVSMQPALEPGAASHTVLLEVGASLRYFGGIERLGDRIDAALAPFGHLVQRAHAATAQGAAILSRLDPPPRCTDLASTRRALTTAPVWLLGPGREHWEALQGMGLRQLGDLLGLPRSGLARRFSETLLLELDAAFGARPDPREPIALPPSFESRLELFARADTTEQVLHGASVLLERLIAWLSAQHAFVRRFKVLMRHESRWLSSQRESDASPQATSLEIALAEPSRDSAHLLVLLRERLARLQLPAPTLELWLQAEDITRRAPPTAELFPTHRSEHEGLTRLIERLQARLGVGQVQRLVAMEEHRPESATVLAPADAGVGGIGGMAPAAGARAMARASAAAAAGVGPGVGGCTAPRPVWIQAPEPLAERGARPLFEGRALQLLSGPERIEAGWWDAALAERDYFIAETGEGALVWIYRDRLPLARAGEGDGGAQVSGWFLQGRFG